MRLRTNTTMLKSTLRCRNMVYEVEVKGPGSPFGGRVQDDDACAYSMFPELFFVPVLRALSELRGIFACFELCVRSLLSRTIYVYVQ